MIRHTVHILNVDIFEVLEIFQLHLPVQCFIITSFFSITYLSSRFSVSFMKVIPKDLLDTAITAVV